MVRGEDFLIRTVRDFSVEEGESREGHVLHVTKLCGT